MPSAPLPPGVITPHSGKLESIEENNSVWRGYPKRDTKYQKNNIRYTVEPRYLQLGYLEQIPSSPRFPIGLSIVIRSPDISKSGYVEQISISPRFPIGLSIVIPSPDISNSRYVEQSFISFSYRA